MLWFRALRVLGVGIVACVMAACGGGGDGGIPPAHVPSISQLSYFPTTFPVSSYGTAEAAATLEFSDAGGDIAVVTIRVTDPQGNEVYSYSMIIGGAEGVTSGVIGGPIQVPTYQAGLYTVHVTVSDSRGGISNEIDGLVTITPAGSGAPAPAAAAAAAIWSAVH